MANPTAPTPESLDLQARRVADGLAKLPWMACVSYMVAVEEPGAEADPEEDDESLLQGFDVEVIDGYVTDFLRVLRAGIAALPKGLGRAAIEVDLSMEVEEPDDPSAVAITVIISSTTASGDLLVQRSALLTALEQTVDATVEEWLHSESDE